MIFFLEFFDYINYMYYLYKIFGGEFKKVLFFVNYINIFFCKNIFCIYYKI